MKSVTIPVSAVGQGLDVVIGGTGTRESGVKKWHFQIRESEWLKPFLAEHSLDGEDASERVQGLLKIRLEGSGLIRVKGTLQMTPTLECVRSLTRFQNTFECSVNALFAKESKLGGGQPNRQGGMPSDEEELELTPEDLDTYFYNGDEITLDELLLDSLAERIPGYPLCRPHCKGLCQECGANLNEALGCEGKTPKECHHFEAPQTH